MKPSETGETFQCRTCRVEKPAAEFYVREESGNRRLDCKVCMIDRQTMRNLKITFEGMVYLEMVAKGLCQGCGCKLNSSRYTRMCYDHDHKTGEIRGLLCVNCNTAIGLAKDSPERLRALADYLERPRYSLTSTAMWSPMAAADPSTTEDS